MSMKTEVTTTLEDFINTIESEIVFIRKGVIDISDELKSARYECADWEEIAKTMKPYRKKLRGVASKLAKIAAKLQDEKQKFK